MDYLFVVIKQHWHMPDTDMPAVLYELCWCQISLQLLLCFVPSLILMGWYTEVSVNGVKGIYSFLLSDEVIWDSWQLTYSSWDPDFPEASSKNSLTLFEICLFSFCPGVRREDQCHPNVCPLNMKLEPEEPWRRGNSEPSFLQGQCNLPSSTFKV